MFRGGDRPNQFKIINPLFQIPRAVLAKPKIHDEEITAETPRKRIKHIILHTYGHLLKLRNECNQKCIETMCTTKDAAVCEQTKQFITTKLSSDSSGFCNNMMAGFPKTCKSTNPAIPVSSYDECACDRFKHALTAFDMLKGRILTLFPTESIADIMTELFDTMNNKPGTTLSDKTRTFIRLVPQNALRKINTRRAPRIQRQLAQHSLALSRV